MDVTGKPLTVEMIRSRLREGMQPGRIYTARHLMRYIIAIHECDGGLKPTGTDQEIEKLFLAALRSLQAGLDIEKVGEDEWQKIDYDKARPLPNT